MVLILCFIYEPSGLDFRIYPMYTISRFIPLQLFSFVYVPIYGIFTCVFHRSISPFPYRSLTVSLFLWFLQQLHVAHVGSYVNINNDSVFIRYGMIDLPKFFQRMGLAYEQFFFSFRQIPPSYLVLLLMKKNTMQR